MNAHEIVEKRERAGIPKWLGIEDGAYLYGSARLSLQESALCRAIDKIIEKLTDLAEEDELAVWQAIVNNSASRITISITSRERAQIERYMSLLETV